MRMIGSFVLATSLLVCPLFGQAVDDLQVRTQSGVISGSVTAEGDVRVFRGVPYAAPPVGDLRWRPPESVGAWDGVRSTTEFGASCETAEDCLYLNIWAPALPTSETSRHGLDPWRWI